VSPNPLSLSAHPATPTNAKNQASVIKAWCMYDWANSVYNLCITTAIFPIYYSSLANTVSERNGWTRQVQNSLGEASSSVSFLRLGAWEVPASSLYSYALALAYLSIALVSPLLSGMADYGARRKAMMNLFIVVGSLACVGLYGMTVDYWVWGIVCFVLAAFSWAGSALFYNSFLPVIASEDRIDAVSAQGFAYGYVGSVLLLVINLAFIMNPGWLGMDTGEVTRLSFVSVGLWWWGFSRITIAGLPGEEASGAIGIRTTLRGWLRIGLGELRGVVIAMKGMPTLRTFLAAYFFTCAGLQTIMLVASLFGAEVLRLPTDRLIAVILLIQLIAIGGSFGFARLVPWLGNVRLLMLTGLIWILVCMAAAVVTKEWEFYTMAGVVGVIMGGSQTLLRSTYAKMIPHQTKNNASFFSFYDLTEKIAIVFGTFSFGFINQWTGSMRNSALFLALYFVVGLFFFARMLRLQKGQRL
jgi:UMF1 family MFS transporter